MKIKAKITERQVKCKFPTRSMRMEGRTTVLKKSMSVTVTDLDPGHERVLALNLGQLATLVNALTLFETAGNLTGGNTYSRGYTRSLIESLEDLKKLQPGLEVVSVEAEGFEKESK